MLYLIICRCDRVIGNINRDHLAGDEIDKYWKLAANVSPKRKKLQNEVMTLLTCLSLRAFLSSSCTFSCWPVCIIRKSDAELDEAWSLADLYRRCGKSRSWCRSCPSCNQGWKPQSGKISIEEKVFNSAYNRGPKFHLQKELVPFTQLVKVRRGKLVLALLSIRFSWNFYQIISGTKYE